MEHDFWHQRWENNQIGFHLNEVNPYLKRYISQLKIDKGDTVFVPLCGKTLDIGYLLEQGLKVVGVELNQNAVESLFDELGFESRTIEPWQQGKRYRYRDLTVYVGDFFELDEAILTNVDAVYDRAALVALPPAMRGDYAKHLTQITNNVQQLLVTLVYDQSITNGPPFSVTAEEVDRLYDAEYLINHLYQIDIIEEEPRFKDKGLSSLVEEVTLLLPK